MIKTLQKVGNSHAVVLDKAMLEAMGVDKDTKLQLTLSGNSLVITPVNTGLGAKAVSASMKKLRPRYKKMLESLAK